MDVQMATNPLPHTPEATAADNESDFYNTSPPSPPARAESNRAGSTRATTTPVKRKQSSPSQAPPKKRKLTDILTSTTTAARGELTPELWQRVFCLLPPELLARVQCVNRQFRHYLNEVPVDESKPGHAQPLHPDVIWATARSLYHPSWPEPPSGIGDRELWQLLMRRTCQFCNRLPELGSTSDDPWATGPGGDGVSLVWQFGVRTCGSCLRQRVQTELSLLSAEQSAFLQVLPFVFLTNSFHTVSPAVIQSGRPIPLHLEPLKYFYTPHVQNAQKLLDAARESGTTTTMLADQLRQIKDLRMESAAVWEQVDYAHLFRSAQTPSTPSATPFFKHSPTFSSPRNPQGSTRRPPSVATFGGRMSSLNRLQNSASRNGRSLNDALEGKAARRIEIERRCRALSPPIAEILLPHMESFQAAIQISNPLTDNDWELLRPRLEGQRENAEQRERERLTTERIAVVDSEERRKQDAVIREAKEETDRHWEEAQEPLRQRLGGYADDIIRDHWSNGQSLTAELMPKFAADVLVGVRSRYYSDLVRNDSGSSPGSTDSHTSSQPRRLVLDNMRWVYDTKVKPLTETRKEVFLCNGCDSLRFYAFDGVIQHYAAKHTESFSAGHTVVHWQGADWPEDPPFAPDPDTKKRQDSSFQVPGLHHFPVPMHAQQAPNFLGYPTGMSPGPHGNPAYGQQFGPYQPPGSFLASDRTQHNFSPAGRGGHQASHSFVGLQSASPFSGRNAYWGPGLVTPAPSSTAWGPPPYSQAYPPPPLSSNLYQTQLEEVANVAREVWGLVSNVRSLAQSVRVFCVITSVVNRFQQRFSNEPSLDLFTDCLINHSLMRPLKDANPLACKVCVENNESREGSNSPSFPLSSGERKLYPFHSLLVHFKNVHIEHAMHGQEENRLDWKNDMIELPSDEYISKLSRAPGIDRAKMALLVATFPSMSWATEGEAMTSDPVMGIISTSHSPMGSGYAAPGRVSAASHRTRTSGVQSRASGARQVPPPSVPSATARSPANAEDEYDPRHPAPSGRVSQATSRGTGHLAGTRRPGEAATDESRREADNKTDRASQFLADFGDELQQSKPARGAGSASGASGRDRSPASQPTEETLAALREQGFIVIPPEAPEHYERQQSMPLRRQRQRASQLPPPRYRQHHPYPRGGGYRSSGYSSRYRDERPLPRHSYARYMDYQDEYDDYHIPPPPPPARYGMMQPESDIEPYDVVYMRRQDIPRYYAPADHYEEERASRHMSERYSRPPVAYDEDDADAAIGTKETEAGSRAGSRAR
ncbi:hypothetical protein FH972_024213 [Carpinus fangiana]|uniref:DUF7892 domain-containing protein n=1 Tax=Carpinus fangiana TaxID=176857 RepID=A0A5N6KXP8_9ROSI|nr:hypothetical protein FH972_024213 [Carpinus fangiana]